MKSYKIGYSENLNTLVTYINTSPKYIFWFEFLQFAVDYDCFVEFYMNLPLLEKLKDERNAILIKKSK